jgi:serine phosphatase RsbU (regulator of sigma subunit)
VTADADADRRIADLTRMVDRERTARVARRELQRLAAASVAAGTVDEVLQTIVRGASGVLGSHITSVAMPTDDGQVRIVHLDGAPVDLVARWGMVDRQAGIPLVRALDEGTTWIELLDRHQIAEWPAVVADAARAEIGSYVAVPLRARSSRVPIAALGFGFRTETALDSLDRALIAELSELASDALERVAELQYHRSVAETLQHALLPRRLPVVDGLTLRALYEPCAGGTQVGGDWYDVVRIHDGSIGLVVGDVAGHDVTSAAEMGRIRHVLASHLFEHGDPAVALTLADRYFETLADGTFATAVVMVLDPSRTHLQIASAGHLPPLMIDRDVVTRVPVEPGPPIGSGLGDHRCTATVLRAGASVLAFTDGVIERRDRTIDACLDELARELTTLAERSEPAERGPSAIVRVVREHLGSPDRTDDAAVLLATRT